MTTVLHRSRGHAKKQPPRVDAELLETPGAAEILARLDAAVDPDYPRRVEHIAFVAAVVIRAKKNPTNVYARPTL